jgi:hypothetical protein
VRTEENDADTVLLWRDGIEVLRDNLVALDGYRPGNEEEGKGDRVLLGVLTHGLNTQLAGYHLAATGYYAQALLLTRICVEDWLTWWYVYSYPAEAERFLGEGAPRWIEMRRKLESGPAGETFRSAQSVMNWLHKLSHVEWISLSHTWDGNHLPIGVRYDTESFISCAANFSLLLNLLLDTVEKMCQLCGVDSPKPGYATIYRERQVTWQRMHFST